MKEKEVKNKNNNKKTPKPRKEMCTWILSDGEKHSADPKPNK